MRDPSATESLAATRDEITKLAVVGDTVGLRRVADRLPATVDASYDRHRARAMALALEGKSDQAVAELNAGAADRLQDPSTVAADFAELRLLAGDPRAAVDALAYGLTAPPARGPRRALAGALAGAGAVAGAIGSSLRVERPIDDRVRVAAGAAALAAAVIALLLLPRTLDDEHGGRTATELARPDRPGPSVIRVASPPILAPAASQPGAGGNESGQVSSAAGQSAAGGLPPAAGFGGLSPARPEPNPPVGQPVRPPNPSTPPPAPPTSPPPAAPAPTPDQPPPVQAEPAQATRAQRSPTQASSATKAKNEHKHAKKDKKEKAAAERSSKASGVSDQVPQGPPPSAAEQQSGPPGQEKKGDGEQGHDDKEKGPKK